MNAFNLSLGTAHWLWFLNLLSSSRMSSFLFFLFLPLRLPLFYIYKRREGDGAKKRNGKGEGKRDRWEFEREKEEKSAWDLLALKLFHLMALRGIDGGREGAQRSIKSEKGEIKSSPSHHLLKWLYSFFCHHCIFSRYARTWATKCNLSSSYQYFPHLPVILFFLFHHLICVSVWICARIVLTVPLNSKLRAYLRIR